MKKILALLLALAMVFSFAACGSNDAKKEDQPQQQEEQKPDDGDQGEESGLPEIKDVSDKVTFKDFCFKVNGAEVKNADLADLAIKKIKVTTTNSKGVTSEDSYTGYVLSDVLKACGVNSAKSVSVIASDGYESKLGEDLIDSEYTLLAIEKNKEQSEDGTIWVAPCSSEQGNVYSKFVVEIKAE